MTIDLIRNMKKAELHVHLDGCLRPETVYDLAEKDGVLLPAKNIEELRKYLSVEDNNKSLVEYLEKFRLPLEVMQKIKNLKRIACEFIEDLSKQNYIYVEVRFAPHLHTKLGLSLEAVTQAVLDGLREGEERFRVKWGLILCIMRHMPVNLGYDIVNIAEKYRKAGVVAIDLAGAEKEFPVTLFKDVFKSAKDKRLNITIHAGEADGAESVKNAIGCGAMRIGHGIRTIENEEVIKLLVEKEITIEVCPNSNKQTKVFDDFSKYPLKRLMSMGVTASLNTDSSTVSDTSINKEAETLIELGVKEEDIKKMVRNSIIYSFADEQTKKELIDNFEKSIENTNY